MLGLAVVIVLLPIIIFRLLSAKSGSVFIAKWDDRIESAAEKMDDATMRMNQLTLSIAKSRITELEIASRSAYLPDPTNDKQRLLADVEDISKIIRDIEQSN
jgi:hypothetical protein